ncbi:MAG: hypothetical protein IH845_05175 [Nanoarchaeota archaeon]|nr:hypothetical protein [Nanoarchaeota archaeon]
MSSFIVENKSINNIVNSFFWKIHDTYLRDEIKKKFKVFLEKSKDEELNKELKKFGQLMVNLNRDSVNQRYDEKEKPYTFIFSDVKSLSNFQFLKSVECLTYQSCEGNCDKTEIYKFLQELEEVLRNKIIQNIEDYKKAKWE